MYGVTGPTTGAYTVDLDGSLVATLDGYNDVFSHNALLYFQTNLDPALTHTLILTAAEGSESGQVGLIIDSWAANGPQGHTGFM